MIDRIIYPQINSRGRPWLGPLELAVMAVLWEQTAPVSVKDVQTHAFSDRPYSTIMTTMDRLARKGLLSRTKISRAFRYQAIVTRTELEASWATAAIGRAIKSNSDQADVRVLMSTFLDAIGEDEATLQALEDLVRAKRAGNNFEDPL